jgi:hypothetical protein
MYAWHTHSHTAIPEKEMRTFDRVEMITLCDLDLKLVFLTEPYFPHQ